MSFQVLNFTKNSGYNNFRAKLSHLSRRSVIPGLFIDLHVGAVSSVCVCDVLASLARPLTPEVDENGDETNDDDEEDAGDDRDDGERGLYYREVLAGRARAACA